MNSLGFFIQDGMIIMTPQPKHNHKVFFTSLLLAGYFHLLASVFQQWRQKNFDSFDKPRHGSLFPFYIGLLLVFLNFNPINFRVPLGTCLTLFEHSKWWLFTASNRSRISTLRKNKTTSHFKLNSAPKISALGMVLFYKALNAPHNGSWLLHSQISPKIVFWKWSTYSGYCHESIRIGHPIFRIRGSTVKPLNEMLLEIRFVWMW